MEAAGKYPIAVRIKGIGHSVPKKLVTSDELERKYKLESGWCRRKLGISGRYWVTDESAAELCAQAAAEAIQKAAIGPGEIDLILNASNTFDRILPDQSIQIKDKLNLTDPRTGCISVNCGCLSVLAALDLGGVLIASGVARQILIVGSLISSPSFNEKEIQESAALGDGAAALILGATKPQEDSCLYGARMETYSGAHGIKGFKGTKKHETLFSKDILFDDLTFEFDSQTMQQEGMKYNKNFVARLFPVNKNCLQMIIPNQSTRIASDMMKLMFPARKVFTVIDQYGNIGAAGHIMALYHAVESNTLKRGDMVLLHGMGAGLSIYGVLLKY
ncbi:MAG: hypothetical protein LBQ71_11335 [Hungatella sp.]|jgi:3-oxoacyl-[acyl-carrier-protein] synthase-3|nr:hypothetical protein [Hungatella sp.]